MLRPQPLAKGGMISSGLDVYGTVAEMEQTWTLQCQGCSAAARSKNTFSPRNPSMPHLKKQIWAAPQYCKVDTHTRGVHEV